MSENTNLWREIACALARIPDYQSGVLVKLPDALGGESRFYYHGTWDEMSFAAMQPQQSITVNLDDIFPVNHERD